MDDSPLKRLPGELYNRITILAVTYADAVPLSHISSYNALSQTCQQLRKDTRESFWELNTFHDEEPNDKTEISKHTKRLEHLLTPDIVKLVISLELSLELRTATPQTWKVSIKPATMRFPDCEKVTASGNTRIAQGRVWVFSRYLDGIFDAYQRAGLEIFATPKFGRQDGDVRRFWAVRAEQ